MAEEARFDRWRTLLHESRQWDRSLTQQESDKAQHHSAVTNTFQ
jgi:hypothetical protein